MPKHKAIAPMTEHSTDSQGQRRLPPLLRHAWYGLNQVFRRRINHLEITPDQFTVLRWLTECNPEGVTQRFLADLMSSDPNTVTSVLNRMESAQLIERRQHESDKRAKRVIITEKGKSQFIAAKQIAIELQSSVLQSLPDDRREQFLSDLETVASTCREIAEHTHD